MQFTSMAYILFIVLCALVFYVVPKKVQWIVLLVFSYIFYFLAGPKLVVFLLLTTLTTYFGGIMIEKTEETKVKIGCVLGCLFINFGVLFLLKYLNFSFEVINSLFNTQIRTINWALPLGISFYTFQSVGYLLDVYWERTKAEHNLAKHMLFVSFFPQILQGPISRHKGLSTQLFSYHNFDLTRIEHAAQRIMWGYFLKFVLADRAGVAVNQVISNYELYDGTVHVFAILMYSIQLYADFSGGMDVVIGTAELFGIVLDENFKRPYFATSLVDFWHRWHITLGTWMKDYVFYPLSLSPMMMKLGKKTRKKFGRRSGTAIPVAICNLIVFLVVGIWHGAGGKYLIYGLYNGVIIAAAELLAPCNRNMLTKLGVDIKSTGLRIFRIILTFVVVNISWYFDIPNDVKSGVYMLKHSFTDFHLSTITDGSLWLLGIGRKDAICLVFGCVVLFAVSFLKERGLAIRDSIDKRPLVIRWALYFALVFAVLILGKYSNGGFIYAQF